MSAWGYDFCGIDVMGTCVASVSGDLCWDNYDDWEYCEMFDYGVGSLE